MRAGQAAELEARRRRSAERAAQLTRQQLQDYWKKQQPLQLSRWTDDQYYHRAQQDALLLALTKQNRESLEIRKNKLSIMLFHENLHLQAELKEAALAAKLTKKQSYLDTVPFSIIRQVNLGIKAKEEERRRKEAELRLYHQWRSNQPAIKLYENQQRRTTLKSAWMEQIIEKEQQKQKEEEEAAKFTRNQNDSIKSQLEKEKEDLMIKEEKTKQLKNDLKKQMEELQISEKIACNLRMQEDSERNLLNALQEITIKRDTMTRQKNIARITYLNNMSLHARRLRDRAREAEKQVQIDQSYLASIMAAVDTDKEKVAEYRKEWKKALVSAQESMEKQRELEKLRQKRLEDAMDGEARAIFQKQEKTWQQEKEARNLLLDQVITTLMNQVKEKIEQNKEQLKENIVIRQQILQDIEKYNEEINERQMEKDNINEQVNKLVKLQLSMKSLKKEEDEKAEEIQREKELQEAIKEENRLRKEILRLQKEGCGSLDHRRRRVLW